MQNQVVKILNYNDFISKIKEFETVLQEKRLSSVDDNSEILFISTYRRIFILDNLIKNSTKLTIEVHTNIPKRVTEISDQQFLNTQLHTMIDLFSYLLELQQNSFIIDALPEEAIWYASIELNPSNIDEQLFSLLNMNEQVL